MKTTLSFTGDALCVIDMYGEESSYPVASYANAVELAANRWHTSEDELRREVMATIIGTFRRRYGVAIYTDNHTLTYSDMVSYKFCDPDLMNAYEKILFGDYNYEYIDEIFEKFYL